MKHNDAKWNDRAVRQLHLPDVELLQVHSTSRNIQSTLGNIQSTSENIQSTLGNIQATSGNIQSTLGNIQLQLPDVGLLQVQETLLGDIKKETKWNKMKQK
jgi:hypothetical protein